VSMPMFQFSVLLLLISDYGDTETARLEVHSHIGCAALRCTGMCECTFKGLNITPSPHYINSSSDITSDPFSQLTI